MLPPPMKAMFGVVDTVDSGLGFEFIALIVKGQRSKVKQHNLERAAFLDV